VPLYSQIVHDHIPMEPVFPSDVHDNKPLLNIDNFINSHMDGFHNETTYSIYSDNHSLFQENQYDSHRPSKISEDNQSNLHHDCQPQSTKQTFPGSKGNSEINKRKLGKQKRIQKALKKQEARNEFPNNLKCKTEDGQSFFLWQMFDKTNKSKGIKKYFIEVEEGKLYLESLFKVRHVIKIKQITKWESVEFLNLNYGEKRVADFIKLKVNGILGEKPN